MSEQELERKWHDARRRVDEAKRELEHVEAELESVRVAVKRKQFDREMGPDGLGEYIADCARAHKTGETDEWWLEFRRALRVLVLRAGGRGDRNWP